MRIVPQSQNPSSFTHTSSSKNPTTSQHTSSAPSAPGIHDTLRHGIGASPYDEASPSQPVSAHPLEARLRNWEATQENLRMESLRRTHGMAEPIRRGMELKIVRDGVWRPMALGGAAGGGGASVHEDILRGKDDSLTWEDVFTGEERAAAVGFHEEMEKKCRV